MIDRVVNFSDPIARSRVAAWFQQQRGQMRLVFCRYRPRRSDRQNRYYWPCFIEPYAAHLTDLAGERVTEDEAHCDLKRRFLARRVICPKTGVLLAAALGSSAALDTAQFNKYLDECADYLAMIGVEVPPPSDYRETIDSPRPARLRQGVA